MEACAKELSVRAFSAAFLCASAALLCASACASFAFGVVVVFATAAVFAGVVFETTAVDFFAVDTTADFVSALYAFFAISICFLAFAFSNCAFFAAKSEAFSAEEAGTVIVPAPAETCAISEDVVVLICVLGIKRTTKGSV